MRRIALLRAYYALLKETGILYVAGLLYLLAVCVTVIETIL